MHTPAVNDAPSFNVTSNTIIVNEDDPPYNATWVTAFSAGDGEDQNVTFSIMCDSVVTGGGSNLFSKGPSIDDVGRLSFTLTKDAFGSSSCNVTLTEEGAGGMASRQPLTIQVRAVNDPPSFTPGMSPIQVASGSSRYSETWATDVYAGPRMGTPGWERQDLQLTVDCDDNTLFAVVPTFNLCSRCTEGVLNFVPSASKSGSTDCNVTLLETEDDGLSIMRPLTIVVEDGEAAGWRWTAAASHMFGC